MGFRSPADSMSRDSAPTWFGQPRGLTILFLTEMWEQLIVALAYALLAGAVGTLWSSVNHAQFFAILAVLAMAAGAMLLTMDRSTSRIESER